ncbi:AmpG family muropeptide MFS transporter [Coralloluteibacterium thermophilus]|uniref:AmpG family muropeptide MFS transporter n=1 Tax=Coralloluteibacterium thermophilum TaxID=2707049 RepID=A0ABV9NK08_9GAMM
MSASATHRGWRGVVAAFGTPSALTLFLFGFGCGLPFLLVGYTLSIWLRDSGWDLGPIGLVSYITFFYVFKFLWAPLLDTRRAPVFGVLGRRRGWLAVSQIFLLLGLAAMGLVGPGVSVPLFLCMVALTALAGASQDIMVDAYRIEIAPLEAQGALAATYILGYRIGLICGGSLALYLAEFGGWGTAYLVMAALVLPPLLATLLSREPVAPARTGAERPSFGEAYVQPVLAFFRHKGVWFGLALLAFVGLFKLPDQMLGVIAGPFYRDSGFSKSEIGTVSGLYGVWIGIAGAFLGGIAVAAWGMRLPLVLAAFGVALSNLLFILMALYPGELWTFVLTISGDNIAQGFAGTVLVAFMSSLVDRSYTATQYALLSSLANLPGKLIGGVSGYMAGSWGYSGFFVFSTLSIVPTLLVLAWLWPRISGAGTSAERS